MSFVSAPSRLAAALLSTAALAPLAATPGLAEATEAAPDVEEITVTGTHIRRKSTFDNAQPLKTIGSEALERIGAKTISDAIEGLTINTGAQNNTDIFTQNLSPGTGNINLRGLGVASTLVLLNGKRQVSSGIQTLDGVSFVDTSSLVPKIAIDRMEILKDGASATYGSDAVAGVVNFFTRDRFEGLELTADLTTHLADGSQDDRLFEALYGVSFDRTNAIIAVSYLDRTMLEGTEVNFLRTEDNTSALGNPGAYFGVPGAGSLPVIDSGCADVGGIPQVIADTPAGLEGEQIGYCRFDYKGNQALVPDEERILGFARITHDLSDTVVATLEAGLARNSAARVTSPSYPFLGSPEVPASHPANPYGADVIFFGRPYANGFPSEVSYFENDTERLSFDLKGELENGWIWETTVTHARNRFQVDIADTVVDNFRAALQGYGGTGCGGADDPAAQPGVDGCLYFNPFATALTAADGSALANDPALYDYIIGRQTIDAKARLTVVDAVVSGELFDLPAGSVGAALGGQFRRESLSQDFDDISNADGFSFLVGNPDFDGSRKTYAVFGELSVPLLDNLELQTALRYEESGGSSTVDPKLTLMYRASDTLVLRGSYGTSYRAPSIFQSLGIQTSFQQIVDADGSVYFVSVRSFGDEALEAETATAYSFGISWQPTPAFELDIDYWHFDFENVLTQEAPQAIVDANPDDARITRSLGGTILAVETNFVNASLIETSGLDVTASYTVETGFGTFAPMLDATYVLKYDLEDPQAGLIEGAGGRNFRNFGSPTPELRANATLGWNSPNQGHGASVSLRYISELDDDQNPGETVADTLTLDLQYRMALDVLFGWDNETELTFGALNVTRSGPPHVSTNGNFETRVYGPWGQRAYVRLKTRF